MKLIRLKITPVLFVLIMLTVYCSCSNGAKNKIEQNADTEIKFTSQQSTCLYGNQVMEVDGRLEFQDGTVGEKALQVMREVKEEIR